jgi:hypothetical protein
MSSIKRQSRIGGMNVDVFVERHSFSVSISNIDMYMQANVTANGVPIAVPCNWR